MRITSGSSCAHGRVEPTSTSGSSRGAAASSAHVAARDRDAAGRPPTPGSARAGRSARAPRATSCGGARVHRRVGRLGDHDDPLALDAEVRRPRPRRRASVGTITRAARCTARWRRRRRRPGAQVLAAALQRRQVVDRDDHRARAVQHRARHPRRVEDVGAARARDRRRAAASRAISSPAAAVSRSAPSRQRA